MSINALTFDANQTSGAEPADRPDGTARSGRRRQHLSRLSGVYVLAAFIIVYAIWVPDTFMTIATFQGILGDQAIAGIVTVGVVIGLSAGAFDLSFANNMSMSGVICGTLMFNHHFDPYLAIAIAIASGVLVGLVNALLVVRIGVNSIVATLGMSSVLAAVTSWLTHNGQFVTGFPKSFTDLATPKPLGIPLLAVIFAVIALAGWYFLEHSPSGRRLQATGFGPGAARLAGVNTGRVMVVALLVIAVTSSIAGVLVTARVNAATPDVGAGYLLPVVAGAFLGTTQLKPGRFNIGGTVLSIYLLAVGVKGLQLGGGGQAWITDLFNGSALILAVSFAAVAQRSNGGLLRRLGIRRASRPTELVEVEN